MFGVRLAKWVWHWSEKLFAARRGGLRTVQNLCIEQCSHKKRGICRIPLANPSIVLLPRSPIWLWVGVTASCKPQRRILAPTWIQNLRQTLLILPAIAVNVAGLRLLHLLLVNTFNSIFETQTPVPNGQPMLIKFLRDRPKITARNCFVFRIAVTVA